MFTALYQVAKNTFRESLREPIFLLVLLTSLVMIGFFPVFSMFVFRAQERLVVDSSMATMMLFGWGMAVLIASYAISREIDNGTALLLLSKPVQRHIFIIAKILGILGAVTVFWFLTAVATMISLRVAVDQFWIDMTVFYIYFAVLLLSFGVAAIHNYISRSSFPMMAVAALCVMLPILAVYAHFRKYQGEVTGLSWYIVPALLLILFSIWAMAALATALSTRFNLTSNLLLCSVFFLVGLMSDYCLGRFTKEPWFDSVPTGKQALWMSSYEFSPTEVDVKKWSRPELLDENNETFRVWSSRERIAQPSELPKLGSQPRAAWLDDQGWKKDPAQLDATPWQMAEYDAITQTWKICRIRQEGPAEKGARFTAYVFRRSLNPPRVPTGGSYRMPLPHSGSVLATVAYALVPNWQLFWMADTLAAQKPLPANYVLYGLAYSIVMVAFLMLLAVSLFGKREVAGRVG